MTALEIWKHSGSAKRHCGHLVSSSEQMPPHRHEYPENTESPHHLPVGLFSSITFSTDRSYYGLSNVS